MEQIEAIRLSDEEKQIVGSFIDLDIKIAGKAGVSLAKVFCYLCSHSKLIQCGDKNITKFDELISLDDVRTYNTHESFKCCNKEAEDDRS